MSMFILRIYDRLQWLICNVAMEDEKNLYLTSLLHLARCLASLNPAPADKVCCLHIGFRVVMGCGYMSGTGCGISFVISRRGNSNTKPDLAMTKALQYQSGTTVVVSTVVTHSCCTYQHTHTHTHTHPFNGPLSGTTRVSPYQKGKTNLDFAEARDSEWQWNPLGHMQVCT